MRGAVSDGRPYRDPGSPPQAPPGSYTSRLGEIKLNPWRDGLYNLWFLVKKRFTRRA